MSAPGWEDIAAIAEDLLDLAVDQREAELVRRCDGDAALESAVRKLLAEMAGLETDEFLRKPVLARGVGEDPIAQGLKGVTIGGFVIERALGEGGMGIVFEARQRKPERRVAMKVLRPQFASQAAVRRFEFEAEILGRMQHPAIATVLASGVHRFEGGGLGFDLPWYAMELFEGARDLRAHNRERSLTLSQKIDLFIRISEGVHHAHQRGVIHRDLKPANILIDSKGDPKVIDFGIARMTEDSGGGIGQLTAGTSAYDLLGTLRYMAPEQVDGRADRVDVRTDVYALGVVLFEVITDSAPLDLDEVTLDEAMRRIRLEPPRKLRALNKDLPAELEWIVDSCLAKDSQERYPSVAELAADLERFRRNEAISVGPPDLAYRLRKYVRRNRVMLAVAAVIVVLLGGWIVSLRSAVERATNAETDASQRAKEAEEEAEKLRTVRGYFAVALDRASSRYGGADVSFRYVIDELERAMVSHELPMHLAATMRFDVANYRIDLGQYDRAIELLEDAMKLMRGTEFEGSYEWRESQITLARAQQMKGEMGQAKKTLEELPPREPVEKVDVDLVELRGQWEKVRQLLASEDSAEAEKLLRKMLEPFERGAPDPSNNANILRGGLASVLVSDGRFDEAEAFAQRVLDEDIRLYGENSWRAANSEAVYAAIRTELGFAGEAAERLNRVAPILEAEFGAAHRYTLGARERRAIAHRKLGKLDLARQELEEVLAVRRGESEVLSRDTLLTMSRLAEVLVAQLRFEEAEALLREGLARSLEPMGENHVLRGAAMAELGRVLVLANERDEGLELLANGIERMTAKLSPDHRRVRAAAAWFERAKAGTLRADDEAITK